jgi:hypothetical protein
MSFSISSVSPAKADVDDGAGAGGDAVLDLSEDRRASKAGSRSGSRSVGGRGHRRTESHVSRVSQVRQRPACFLSQYM